MEIDPLIGIDTSGRESAALGKAETALQWPYSDRNVLFGLIRARKQRLDGFDPSSLPLGAARAQMVYEQQMFGSLLETMLQEIAPHIEETGITEGAESLLKEIFG